MHIEFKLPSGAGGQAAHYSCTVLNQALKQWQDLYGFQYTTEITYYRLTLRFHDDRALTWFLISWPTTVIQGRVCED